MLGTIFSARIMLCLGRIQQSQVYFHTANYSFDRKAANPTLWAIAINHHPKAMTTCRPAHGLSSATPLEVPVSS